MNPVRLYIEDTSDPYLKELIRKDVRIGATSYEHKCQDEERRRLWICSDALVKKLERLESTAQLHYSIFAQYAMNGPIALYRKSRAAERAAKDSAQNRRLIPA